MSLILINRRVLTIRIKLLVFCTVFNLLFYEFPKQPNNIVNKGWSILVLQKLLLPFSFNPPPPQHCSTLPKVEVFLTCYCPPYCLNLISHQPPPSSHLPFHRLSPSLAPLLLNLKTIISTIRLILHTKLTRSKQRNHSEPILDFEFGTIWL